MSDEFMQSILHDPNKQEALRWLKGGREGDFRSVGELGTNEESIALIQRIYDAGAVEVIAVRIDEYPGEGQNTGKLVIKLPDEPELRQGLFALAGGIAQRLGFDPEQDTGQTYLFLMLD